MVLLCVRGSWGIDLESPWLSLWRVIGAVHEEGLFKWGQLNGNSC